MKKKDNYNRKSVRKSSGIEKNRSRRGRPERFASKNQPFEKEQPDVPVRKPDRLKSGRIKQDRPEEEKTGKKSFIDRTKRLRKQKPPNYRFKKTNLDEDNFNPGKKKRPFSSRIKQPVQKTGDEEIRLNRYIANSGICSRREADELIVQGLIKVNGKVVTELGTKVKRTDSVKYNDKVILPEKPVYVLLNKPKDFITTVEDPENRKTVMQLVANACNERIYPVGRLDRNTTGLLLLTNDGDMAEKLSHPSRNIKKIYQVDLNKPVPQADIEKIAKGVELEDGLAQVDEVAVVTPDRKSLGVELHSGKNRIVRRIFESLGYEVLRLDRVMYAGLTKKDLPRGNWRYLSEQEVIRLKHFIK